MNAKLSVSKFVIGYYVALIIVCFILMRPGYEVPTLIRIILTTLCIIPVFFNNELLLFSILCFYGISSTSFSPILPSVDNLYLVIVVVFYIMYRQKTRFKFGILTAFGYFLFVSLLYFDFADFITWLLIAILLSDMVKDKRGLELLFYAFISISLVLSLLFLVYRGEFLVQYGSRRLGMERTEWTGANSFGMTIGAGGVLCAAYLTGVINLPRKRMLIVICITTLILSLICSILNASRGSLAAYVIPSLCFFLISKSKIWIKVLMVVAVGIVMILMFRNNMFELLTARMGEANLVTAGGRTSIWKFKINYFLNDPNPFHLLFGIGLAGCNELGSYYSTHNDFLTSFIGFGFVGLLVFSYFIIVYPIKLASKKDCLIVSFLMMYVFIECWVIEPFFRGKIIILMYYIFTLKYAIINKSSALTTQEQ